MPSRERRERAKKLQEGQAVVPAAPGGRDKGERPYAVMTAHALFIPDRDNPLRWESPAAEFLGDPPIGRRAIDGVRS